MKLRRIVAITIFIGMFIMLMVYMCNAQTFQAGYNNASGDDNGYLNYKYTEILPNKTFNASLEGILKDSLVSFDVAINYGQKINYSYGLKCGFGAIHNERLDLKKIGANVALNYSLQTDEWTVIYYDIGLDGSIIINRKSGIELYYELGYKADFDTASIQFVFYHSGELDRITSELNYKARRIDNASAFVKYINKIYQSDTDYLFTTGIKVDF